MIAWLVLDFLSLIALSFFSMFEMAAISFDRLKVDYYVARGYRRIIWLQELLDKPSALFGTTLVGVNLSLVFGAECSRNLFFAWGISPDFAPLMQITLAIILGELAPMFAARKHPEHVVFLGIPLIYWTSRVLAPFLHLVEWFSRFGNKLVRSHQGELTFIPREELVEMIEGSTNQDVGEEEGSRRTLSAIFSLGERNVASLLQPIESFPILPLKVTVGELRERIKNKEHSFVLLKAEDREGFLGWVALRDLLRVPDNRRVRDWLRQPTFVDQKSSLLQLLNTFRKEKVEVVVGVDEKGMPKGLLTFEDLILSLFPVDRGGVKNPNLFVDRTFDGNTPLSTVEAQLETRLGLPPDLQLSEFMEQQLGEHPEEGAHFTLGGFDWRVQSLALLAVERVRIKSFS